MKNYVEAYDTPLNGNYQIDDIRSSILKSLITGRVEVKIDGGFHYLTTKVILITDENKEVKHFPFPVEIIRGSDKFVAIDVRKCTKLVHRSILTITNKQEFNFLFLLAKIHMAYSENKRNLLMKVGTFPLLTYSRWVSENISRVLGLPIEDQTAIMVVSALWFLRLFNDNSFDISTNSKNIFLISKTLRLPAGLVEDIVSNIEKLDTTEEFIEEIKKAVNSPRMKNLDLAATYNYLSSGWISYSYKQLIASALDYVPCWLTICQLSLNDRSASRTTISKMVQSNAKGNDPTSFLLTLASIVGK